MNMLFRIVLPLLLTATAPSSMISGTTADSTVTLLFDSFFCDVIRINPELGEQLGIPPSSDAKVDRSSLTDISIEAENREFELLREYRARLNSFDPDKLDPSERITHDALLWYLEDRLAGERFRYHGYLINPMFGMHNQLTTLLTEYHRIRSREDAENYIARLEGYGTKTDQLLEQLEVRRQEKIYPPREIIQKTSQVMTDFIKSPPGENILFTSFRDEVKKLDQLDLREKKALYDLVRDRIETVVYPSYRRVIAHLEEIYTIAGSESGAWKLPDGQEYYRYCLRSNTTIDVEPDKVHDLGLREVRRIEKEMDRIFDTLGIAEGGTPGARFNRYLENLLESNADNFFYPNSSFGRQQTLEDFASIVEELQNKLKSLFLVYPKSAVSVKPVPEFMETTMGTHYSRPSLDGEREGIFYVNLGRLPSRPGMKTLTCHEAVPGHHFQIASQEESPRIHVVHNLFHFPGYTEGWALYAERLGYENGWFEDDYEKLGYLASELLRAVRLVVDTGLHHKKWTRTQTFDYMVKHLGWGSQASIDRYILWPGQACAYKLGELKILELREKMKKELGPRFDIREFHRVVLENGAVPLGILERLVEDYVENNGQSDSI